MAKTAKLKKKRAPSPPQVLLSLCTPLTPPPEVTVRSRAARRAVSPSINIGPIKSTPADSEPKPHVLSAKKSGISKPKKSNLKRAQRERYQKGLERGADNMDKLELKRQKSKLREKNVKERAKGWEDINGESTKRKKGAFDALAVEGDDDEDEDEKAWVDEDMDEAPGKDADVQDTATEQGTAVAALPVVDDELL